MAVFQIVSFEIEQRDVYIIGERVPVKLTLKNVSGKNFKSVDISLECIYYTAKTRPIVMKGAQYIFPENTVWNANETKTATAEFDFSIRQGSASELPEYDAGLLGITTVTLGYTKADWEGTVYQDNERTLATVRVLQYRDDPRFKSFDMYRSDDSGVQDDEGEAVRFKSIRFYIGGNWETHGYTMDVSVTPSVPDLVCDFTLENIAPGGSMRSNAIRGTFSKGKAYTIRIAVTNGIESAEASVIIPKAFANMHLSGAENGGVRFGGFSTATDDQPKFECDFPAFFYAGAVMHLPAGVYECPKCIMSGHVTSSQQNLIVTLPFLVGDRKAEDFTISFTGTVSPRTHTGYMWPTANTSGSNMSEDDFKVCAFSVYSVSPGAIQIQIAAPSKWYQSGTATAVQNNSLADITFNGALVVTVAD